MWVRVRVRVRVRAKVRVRVGVRFTLEVTVRYGVRFTVRSGVRRGLMTASVRGGRGAPEAVAQAVDEARRLLSGEGAHLVGGRSRGIGIGVVGSWAGEGSSAPSERA